MSGLQSLNIPLNPSGLTAVSSAVNLPNGSKPDDVTGWKLGPDAAGAVVSADLNQDMM